MTFPGSASPKLRFVAAAAAFATLYFVTAELTSSLAGDVGIAVLWPASGVYLGLMLVAPRQLWPALALGAGLGSLGAYAHAGSSLELSVAFAVPSSAEGLLGAVLVERIVRGRFRLGGLRDVSALVIGSAIATALVALSAGAVAAQTFDVSFAESWLRWWSADALGVLAVAPLVVGARRRAADERPSRRGAALLRRRDRGRSPSPCGHSPRARPRWRAARSCCRCSCGRDGAGGRARRRVGGTGVALAAMNLAAGSDLLGGGHGRRRRPRASGLPGRAARELAVVRRRRGGLARERVAAVRSSRRLRAITDSSPDAYVTVDSEGLDHRLERARAGDVRHRRR